MNNARNRPVLKKDLIQEQDQFPSIHRAILIQGFPDGLYEDKFLDWVGFEGPSGAGVGTSSPGDDHFDR